MQFFISVRKQQRNIILRAQSVHAMHVFGKMTATRPFRVATVGASFVSQGIVHDKQLVNLINNYD